LTEEQRRLAAHYERFGPAIYRRCLKLLRDPERARDATQDVFLKLTRDLGRLEGSESVLPWIYRTATHHCLNIIRDTARHSDKEAELPGWELVTQPAQEAMASQTLVARMLGRFDAETRAVAVGVLVDGMEHEEVAAALGISRRTVSRKLARFLVNARKYVVRSEA
jgi:RNA polymerase sigma-70 factor (ECF subfamily)